MRLIKKRKCKHCHTFFLPELSAPKRMLNLGARQTPPKVDRVPHIPMLKENNVKKGFFEHGEFVALRDALPSYLKGPATFAYKTGWRFEEVVGLTWKQVDREQGIVRLEAGETKNDEGRTVYMADELKEVVQSQWNCRSKNQILCPYVFPNAEGKDKIKDFRDSWNKACREAGLGYGYKESSGYVDKWHKTLPSDPTFHDFRRSA